ncbi:hypothetical protein SUGI_0602590 [Cryptomeria japonica]|nr:hypothetical protein SUGI_0602590 [Cryptomeria japonica]
MMRSGHEREEDPLAVLNTLKAALHVNFSDLPDQTKDVIEKEVRRLKPGCPKCSSKDCKYRYLNNKGRSKSIQPRFLCRTCHAQFTLGGKRYNSKMLTAYNCFSRNHLVSTSVFQNAQTMPTQSFIQVPKELGFENTQRTKNNNQGLELHGDNEYNAVIGENFYGQADNLFTPCLDNNVCMSNLAWVPMANTDYPLSSSKQLSLGVHDGYGNHLSSFDSMLASNAAVKGVPYGSGMAEQSWNNSYSPQLWNNHNANTQTPNLWKGCMHNSLGCSCLHPSLEMPMASGGDDNTLQKQMASQLWEENPGGDGMLIDNTLQVDRRFWEENPLF